MNRLLAPAAALLTLTACNALTGPREIIGSETQQWRVAATGGDRTRLRDWRTAFIEALAKARAGGHGREIAAEGALLDPDAGIVGVPIPNGDYRCRVIKLGAKQSGLLDYVAYPAFTCRIQPDKGLQGFAKLSGSQRPVGMIFPGDSMRQVFLGTLVLGDEKRAMQYGRDPDRDLSAFVEKIGPNRWRMVFPRPAFESTLDVIELIPAS
ncbi:DUF4893 domain-containing protein [Sphingomonas sp.]|uniref:DUF4893 domain-containing protein n=1 Tax=Sphingomonas sp. TaxID=28214 RepID=UPI00286BD85E|nr:DUF4893 domain-containing protein [Sphingomonas sp.]